MGADAEIYVFDHLAYREILPVFHQFLLTGQAPKWLHPLITYFDVKAEDWRSVDLIRTAQIWRLISRGAPLTITGIYLNLIGIRDHANLKSAQRLGGVHFTNPILQGWLSHSTGYLK